MKTRKNLLALAVAGVITCSPLIVGSYAVAGTSDVAGEAATATNQAANEAVADASTDADKASFIKTLDEAYAAIRDIRNARLVIFNGVPVEATDLLNQALADLKVAQDSAGDLALKTQKSDDDSESYIPFDESISLVEGFVPDAEQKDALKKAKEHMAKGAKTEAADVLKLANIDVSVTAAMIPLQASLNHVNDAVKLLGEQKYYEANLSLKAVEDSIIVETYDLSGLPAQGVAAKS